MWNGSHLNFFYGHASDSFSWFVAMTRIRRAFRLTVILALWSMTSSCSKTPRSPTPTSFMGHTIGESSMAWSSAESTDTDPLTKCQELRFARSCSSHRRFLTDVYMRFNSSSVEDSRRENGSSDVTTLFTASNRL